MKILLDTNILLIDPTILSKRKPGVSLIVPFTVRMELDSAAFQREGVSSILKILDEAVNENLIQIYRLSSPPSIVAPEKLSRTDIELITAAQELRNKENDVQIATEDKALANFASNIGIKCINNSQLKALFLTGADHNSNIQKKAKIILNAQTRSLIIGIIIGCLGNILAFWIWSNFDNIVNTATTWGTILLVITSGILLYSLRGRFRLRYGIFEFLFGVLVALKVFWPDFDYSKFHPTDMLQIIAGIYVMVRGLDNVGKSLKVTRFGPFWNKISGER